MKRHKEYESNIRTDQLKPADFCEISSRSSANDSSHLYVMQAADGRVKIGRSTNPEERRRSLQCTAGIELVLVKTFPGRGHEELTVLNALARYRILGEWFALRSGVLDAIRKALSAPDLVLPFKRSREARVVRPMTQAEVDRIVSSILARAKQKRRQRAKASLAQHDTPPID